MDVLMWHAISFQVFTVFELKTKDCKGYLTPTRKLYNETYAAEVELNETFHTFVNNYKAAYQGLNTVSAQIGTKYDVEYTEADEWLPLGPSFQEHVNCFVK